MSNHTNLKAFHVGDMDIYAAESAEHALQLANEQHGGDSDTFDLSDVSDVSEDYMDKEFPEFDENELPTGGVSTIRQWLLETVTPGWLCGTEY